ncbi:MAG: hypothetical protein GY953_27800, partial [bacterium]|nr:hypothetical protein [bacterium]
MLFYLLEASLRAALLVGVVWALTRLLKADRPAVLHLLWTGVAAGMLLLLVAGGWIPALPLHVLAAPDPGPLVGSPAQTTTVPAAPGTSIPPPEPSRTNWPGVLWGAVAGLFLLHL